MVKVGGGGAAVWVGTVVFVAVFAVGTIAEVEAEGGRQATSRKIERR
jgi:hypothetical protein